MGRAALVAIAVLLGAGIGALVGMVLGPVGAAIGAVVGAVLFGYVYFFKRRQHIGSSVVLRELPDGDNPLYVDPETGTALDSASPSMHAHLRIQQLGDGDVVDLKPVHECQTVGEKQLRITRDAQTFDHTLTLGFKLVVPRGCLPHNLEEGFITITCYIATSDTFCFPEGTEPVSAVYHIRSTFKLCNSVTLEIEHCCDEGDSQLVSEHSTRRILRFFTGDVEMTDTHCKVNLIDFSLFAIVAAKLGRRRYCGLVYRLNETLSSEQYSFVVLRNLHALSEAVRKWMESNNSNPKMMTAFSEVTFSSGSDEVALDVSGEGVRTKEGWHIFPNPDPAKVTKSAIDGFSTRTAIPPMCTLQVDWTHSGPPLALRHRVTLTGTAAPTAFVISTERPVLPDGLREQGLQPNLSCRADDAVQSPSPSVHPDMSVDAIPTLDCLLSFPVKRGHINVPEMIGAKVKSFGVLLLRDAQGAIMDRIERDHPHNTLEVCTQVLQTWIAGRGRKPTTWNTLIDCLRDADLNSLAHDIESALLCE